jgi:hypothetical protein
LHPGKDLSPLSGERIFAGPSPVQDPSLFLFLPGKLICFSCFQQNQFRCASCQIKGQKLWYRGRLASRGPPSFTTQGRLLQVFHLLEEPKGVKGFRDGSQFLLLGRG